MEELGIQYQTIMLNSGDVKINVQEKEAIES